MAIPYEFEYLKPASLAEALEIKAKYGKSARFLAGGTDIANEMKQGFRIPELLIDIKGIAELSKIELKDKILSIGALATFDQIRKSDLVKRHCYILWEAAGLVASTGVRNRATMVGNICSAVACMDSAAPLLVHEAVIHAQSMEGTRDIPVGQWFVENRKTAIADNEIVIGVGIPLPEVKYGGAYQKMMRYSGEDLSQANVGILALTGNKFRVAFGSVGPIPKRSPKIEHYLNSNAINEKTMHEAKDMIETVIAPITDVRATKEYRIQMTKVMFERALNQAIERLKQPLLITH